MIITRAEMSIVYNEIINIELDMVPLTKTNNKFLQNVCLLLFAWMILFVMMISIADGVLDPFGSDDSIFHGLFFFFCEIVPAMFSCGYYGILILIGFLYEEMTDQMGTSIRETHDYLR